MKVCIDCNMEKEYKDFFKRKDNKDGYRNNCKSCHYIKNKPGGDKYRKKESIIEAHKEYCKNYYLLNKEDISVKNKILYDTNRDEMIKRKVKYYKTKVDKDPLYRFKRGISDLIRKSFKHNGFVKESRTEMILGINKEEFVKYIESKFEPWMTWYNRGMYNGEFDYGWDIDHIIPVSSATTKEEINKLNHYTNLQPLCSKINRDIKRDRLDYEKTQ